MINLDSEDEKKFTIGCAGGITTVASIPIEKVSIPGPSYGPIPMRLSVEGLHGGHSGVDINKGRGNAIKILISLLWRINKQYKIFLYKIKGGNLSNAIPREAESVFFLENKRGSDARDIIRELSKEIKDFYLKTDPNLEISIEEMEGEGLYLEMDKVFSRPFTGKLIDTLYCLPNGPIRSDTEDRNLVITSSNLASIRKVEEKMELVISHRSLYENRKRLIKERIKALLDLSGLACEISYLGDYPGWVPQFNSILLKLAKQTYRELFNKKPKIHIIHAGLETGILKKTFPTLEMISLGPTIKGGHSPKERLKIESIKKIWELLHQLLANLDQYDTSVL